MTKLGIRRLNLYILNKKVQISKYGKDIIRFDKLIKKTT